ncbi:glycosyltransferase family 2 protein [Nocardioides dubius]|uniref:Glycosyltransferase family 2 protein n=1 Tax=Nocardioides dubius TaxID=317019 RepID=A0ABP4EGA5_9ACTN
MKFQRAVGLIIIGSAVAGAALMLLAVAWTDPIMAEPPEHTLVGDTWNVFYDNSVPPMRILVFAVGLGLALAAVVAMAERRIALRARRSMTPDTLPLAPRVIMERTRGIFAGPVTITVLVPAHNEESAIGATIDSLKAQSFPPSRIVVVADNCTDATVQIARGRGVDVLETVDNSHKKAGGLNQALRQVLPDQGDNDLVMVMDADTTLDAGFLEVAARKMTDDRALMAVGGLFYGDEGCGLIGQMQRNEYHRYGRELRRRRGRVYVLTGTATVFRPVALRTVAASRGAALPGIPGDVYDTLALTEDNELTLALKSLGAQMISPQECTVVTEVMPSWRALWAQRLRWQRGALDNLGAYGLTPQTMRYWAQQLGIGYGVLALTCYLLLMALMALSMDSWIWFPFWLGIGGLFVLERMVTVWRGGWRARLLALTLFPELGYAMFLNVVYVRGVLDIALGREAAWKHIVQTDAGVKVSD